MRFYILDPQAISWSSEIERLCALLSEGGSAALFPLHFLQAVLPRIGGQVALIQQDGVIVGIGLLFPRIVTTNGTKARSYTLRYHGLSTTPVVDWHWLCRELSATLDQAPVVLYNPAEQQQFIPTHHPIGPVDVGRPDTAEAQAIRALQQRVWGSGPGSLYPADIHSVEFGLATSLVARMDQQPVGFLMGFDKFGGYPLPADWHERFGGDWRIESQTLGVLPEYRGARLGFLLKQRQAELALARGIQIINWTVDPLQWPNALLNFGRLRALAFDFTPDYYPAFRNALNRLPASRFSLTWLVGTPRVQQALATSAESVKPIELHNHPEIIHVNQDWSTINYQVNAAQIAIEIPNNWTALQREHFAAAEQWRQATDALFQHYIGTRPGQYVVTDVGVAGDKRYLVAEQVCEGIWVRLTKPLQSNGIVNKL